MYWELFLRIQIQLLSNSSGFWHDLLTQLILGVAGVCISTLSLCLMRLINNRVKNENAKRILSNALDVVDDGVTYIHQIYVEGVKGTSLWDEHARSQANQKAVDYIQMNLPNEAKKFIKTSGKDVEEWIQQQIEIAIQKNKNKSK